MESGMENSVSLLLIGGLICSALVAKWGLEKVGVPALIGYLLLGFCLRWADSAYGFLGQATQLHLDIFANVGVVVLLFQVGMESNLAGLISQFRRAWPLWVGNVLVSGGLGYLAAFYLLRLQLIPSLYVAVALTATSVAMSVVVWREMNVLDTENGELLLDVAELDDISAIFLMSLLFAVVPVLQNQTEGLISAVFYTIGVLLAKLLLFGGFCFAFSHYMEHRLTLFAERIRPYPDPMLMLAAVGFMIAALAGLLGFSVAIGAFFAGLIFSRDPEAIKVDRPFIVLYELFSPFFFIGIGLAIDPLAITGAILPGIVLLVVAVAGKLLGTLAPAVRSIGWSGGVLVGLSMIPRAEITMIVMRHDQQGGESMVPEQTFAAMVLVSAVTCVISPLLLRPLLHRWKQDQSEATSDNFS